jgi:hypothetical protein
VVAWQMPGDTVFDAAHLVRRTSGNTANCASNPTGDVLQAMANRSGVMKRRLTKMDRL